ncbi:MAG: hypothetical protein ACK55I_04030, partial [bacterium]
TLGVYQPAKPGSGRSETPLRGLWRSETGSGGIPHKPGGLPLAIILAYHPGSRPWPLGAEESCRG